MDDFSNCTVLVVDDAEANIDVLIGALSPDFEVSVARDGESALEIVESELPDLILLDIMMPGMDGFEVCRKLKNNEKTKHIPVIFVTAKDQVEDETKGLKLGAVDFISKPINPPVVIARVKTHLEQKRLRDQDHSHLKLIAREKEKSDSLLTNILPNSIAKQLKEKQGFIAENYPDTTVLFADIVGFTEMSSKISSNMLVTKLNSIFSAFDSFVEKYDVEKIKTIGDAYMVVGGLNSQKKDHAETMAEMALEIMEEIRHHYGPDGQALNIRIGMHTGPVVAGVIGTKKFLFDLWGDTVNIASRMESQGIPGKIQISPATYQRLGEKYLFEKRDLIHIKGKGEMLTYLLLGRPGDSCYSRMLDEKKKKGEASYGLSRAKEELKTLCLSDDITGIYSRKGFVAFAQQQFKIANRERRKARLLLIRPSNLEWINREYGFEEGDRALKNLARLLHDTFRTSDIITRIGGNLFLIFGLEKTPADHDVLSSRLRKMLEGFQANGAQPYTLSVDMAEGFWNPESSRPLEEILSEIEKKIDMNAMPEN